MQSDTPPVIETVNPESNLDQETYTLDKLPSAEPSEPKQWSQFGKELSEELNGLKQQIVGRQDSQMDFPQTVPDQTQTSLESPPELTSLTESESE